jgi:hypothetical protein
MDSRPRDKSSAQRHEKTDKHKTAVQYRTQSSFIDESGLTIGSSGSKVAINLILEEFKQAGFSTTDTPDFDHTDHLFDGDDLSTNDTFGAPELSMLSESLSRFLSNDELSDEELAEDFGDDWFVMCALFTIF